MTWNNQFIKSRKSMKNLTKYKTFVFVLLFRHITTRKSLSLQGVLILVSSFFWDFWAIKILIFIKIPIFLFSGIWIILRNARLINYEFRMLLFEFAPSYFTFPIFENPQNNANNAVLEFTNLVVQRDGQTIGEKEENLKIMASKIYDRTMNLYKFEKTKIGTYIVNDREMTELQINNTLASYVSKLVPNKPSKTVVDNIQFWEMVKAKVAETKANEKAVLDHNFRIEST